MSEKTGAGTLDTETGKESGRVAWRSAFIVNPGYDLVFFILAPLIAFFLAFGFNGTSISKPMVFRAKAATTEQGKQRTWTKLSEQQVDALDWDRYDRLLDKGVLKEQSAWTDVFIGMFIMAHLVIVFFRSHLNKNIFRQFKARFIVVPLGLFFAIWFSEVMFVYVSVLATWWDVYHSGMQTFGLGRIYDSRVGNDPKIGRRLDWWLNNFLYAGPILAGATMMDHVEDFEEFDNVGHYMLSSIPAYAEGHAPIMTQVVLCTATVFFLYYMLSYWRLYHRGYAVSFQKVALLVTTGMVSIVSWGFNSFGEAFFIMNFFHAWQYFALVWWSEKKHIMQFLHTEKIRFGKQAALLFLLLSSFAYGAWSEVGEQTEFMLCVLMTVSIMHFWYDGFVWSVRRKEI